MARKIMTYNFKGGVGKTFFTKEFSAYLSSIGKKVLIIDGDPQNNVTKDFKIGYDYMEPNSNLTKVLSTFRDYFEYISTKGVDTTKYFFLKEDDMEKLKGNIMSSIKYSDTENVYVIPGDETFGIEERYFNDKHTFMLRAFFCLIDDEFDYILIDCPPAKNRFTYMLEVACDYLLCPTSTDVNAIEAIMNIVNEVRTLNERNYSNMQIIGSILTEITKNSNTNDAVNELLNLEENYNIGLLPSYLKNSTYPGKVNRYNISCRTYYNHASGIEKDTLGKFIIQLDELFDILVNRMDAIES